LTGNSKQERVNRKQEPKTVNNKQELKIVENKKTKYNTEWNGNGGLQTTLV
jgi:hypothetical protein